MPASIEQLDLLLLTVAKPRKIHPDGIHFESLRYLDPVLASYVGENVIIRYEPRDVAEIRVFYRDAFLCRAICPELAGQTIGIKDIAAARTARRRELRGALAQRASVVDRLVAVHQESPPAAALLDDHAATAESRTPPTIKLRRYREDQQAVDEQEETTAADAAVARLPGY